MNLQHIIAEMRAYWLEGQSGGQLLIGGFEACYFVEKTPTMILENVRQVVCRKRLMQILLWEIEAEEQCPVDVDEKLDY